MEMLTEKLAHSGKIDPSWDRFSKLGALRPVLDPRDERGYKNLLLDAIHWTALLPKLKGARRVLDIGCGTGRFASRIIQAGGDYTGIDTSEGMVEMARAANPGISFLRTPGDTLPFADGSFDLCFTCGVLQYALHSNGADRLLREVRRVLVRGGRFILLEQASESKNASDTVAHPTNESDYRSALSRYFFVRSLDVVRLGRLSDSSAWCIRMASALPRFFFAALPRLAQHEIARARRLKPVRLAEYRYYELLLEAE
jgi:SAM-dependent methyltransferase